MDKRIAIALALAGVAGIAGLMSIAVIGRDTGSEATQPQVSTVAPANSAAASGKPSVPNPAAPVEAPPTVEVTDPLAQDIQAAIAARMPQLNACYRSNKDIFPGTASEMVLALHITPEGQASKIGSVRVRAPVDASSMEACVTDVFAEVRFEAIEAPTLVTSLVAFDAPCPRVRSKDAGISLVDRLCI
jgi:hypothetical protein